MFQPKQMVHGNSVIGIQEENAEKLTNGFLSASQRIGNFTS